MLRVFFGFSLCAPAFLMGCKASVSDSGDSTDTHDPHSALCDAGEYVADNQCVPCSSGTVRPAGDDPQGDNTSCSPCEDGEAPLETGESCEPCEEGFVSSGGAERCTACPANTYEVDNACMECEPDFVSEEGSVACELEAASGYLDPRDYGYLFWPGNHWVNWGSFFNVQHVQTGFYGLAFDVSRASFDVLGAFPDEVVAEEALEQDNSVMEALPSASVEYALIKSGGEHRGAQSFRGYDGKTVNPSGLIDMGRYMQRVEIPEVLYADSQGYSGAIELAALPRYFVLTQKVTSSSSVSDLTLSIDFEGAAFGQFAERTFLEGERAISIANSDGEGWVFLVAEREGVEASIVSTGSGGLSFQAAYSSASAGQEMTLSVIGIPSAAATDAQLAMLLEPEEAVEVRFAQLNRDGSSAASLQTAPWDATRGVYVVSLGDLKEVGAPSRPNWNDESIHNWYNRHQIEVEHSLGGPVAVPLAFDGGNNAAFYITGGSPLLRDSAGEPMGVPVQISKNWHESPFWYHLYATPNFDPGLHVFEHTFAHAKWGETYAVQHAQLALIGWGQNQQWDESSLGAWGESITYDPDMTLARATVDDVRPFLVDAKGKWSWTGNVGGASFLVYEPKAGFSSFASHQLGRMRTHYAYTGPNLTNVIYAGISADQKIEARVSTQLGRTDDMVRAYYHLSYTFTEDVYYDRLALFQVAADRYGDNDFARYAYGNSDGPLLDEAVTNHGTRGYADLADRGLALEGEAPWVMLYDNQRTSGSLPEHLANVGFVVRDYRAEIGSEVVTTPHINIVRTFNGGFSQMAFELGVPHDPSSEMIPAGSVVTATVEYLVPPAEKASYYGKSDYLTALAADSYQSTDMMVLLASENALDVEASVGSVLRSHPVEIETVPERVAAEFTLSGGLGYTPIVFQGLVRPDGWWLEKEEGGSWERVDQSVEGNDFWQAYEHAGSGLYDLVFNVQNRELTRYRLVRRPIE